MKNEFVKRFTTSLIVFLISFFLIIKGNIYFNLLLILILFIALIEWFNLCKNKRLFILGSFFLFISLYTTSIFRDENLYFFILIILISISSDIGGYVFGKLFKGPKLTKISPNKTYSGSIGSYFFSLIISLIFLNYIDSKMINSNINLNIDETIILAFIISSINQIGDLIISYFKRLRKIEDTGNLLPGHGGLLDRFDGMLFSVPSGFIFYLYILWKKKLQLLDQRVL